MALKNAKRIDADTKRIDLDYAIKSGKFHSVDQCRAKRVRQFEDLKRRFLDIPESLPFSAADRALVKQRLQEALQALADGR